MRKVLLTAILAALSAFITTDLFADLTQAPVIAQSGNWSVRQVKDFMTDKNQCVALYKSRFDIQVNEGVFYLNMKGKGGVSTVSYKIDDGKLHNLIDWDGKMRDTGTVIIDGDTTFTKILDAKRLRIQVYTILKDLVNEDINLTGLAQVYKVLNTTSCK